MDVSAEADEVQAGHVVPTIESDRIVEWAVRPAEPADVEAIAELRAVVMRPDLERLGRYDAHRVRQRLRDSFSPQYTSVVLAGGAFAGCVTLRPAEDGQWLEHFYLSPTAQGRGLGSAVLRALLDRTDADGRPVRLNVLQGSGAPAALRAPRVHCGRSGPDRRLHGAPAGCGRPRNVTLA